MIWPSLYVTKEGFRSLGRLVRRFPVVQAARMAKLALTISGAGLKGRATQAYDGGSDTLCELTRMRASSFREGEGCDLNHCSVLGDVLDHIKSARRRWTVESLQGFKPLLLHQCPMG